MRFQQWIKDQDVVILDGSMSRLLEEQGLEINHRLWTALALIDQPEAVYQVHKQYFDAGANVAITASYQATVKSFADVGYSEEQAIDFIKHSVTLAQRAKQDSKGDQAKWLAGSIGPYGAYLSDGSEYTGAYQLSSPDMKTFHESRIKTLIASGVDVLAIETIPRLDELRVILDIVSAINFPVWVSVSLKDTAHLANGDNLADFQQLVEQDQNVIAYGINCVSPQLVVPVIETLSVAATKPLVAYPNSGAIFDAVSKTWSEEISVEQVFSTDAKCWHQKGAKLIGGCCCSTAEDIARLARTFCQVK